jgi:hypothetical protein
MIPLCCIVDKKPIPEKRVRRGGLRPATKSARRFSAAHFLLGRKPGYRKAAGLLPPQKSTSGQRDSVPEAVDAGACMATEVKKHPAI